MNDMAASMRERIARLHGPGIVDFHFDLPMALYDASDRNDVLDTQFLPEFEAGSIGVLVAGIYLEERFLPDRALVVALDQIARTYIEVGRSNRFAICKSYLDIQHAREQKKIALVFAMEGVEPLGKDLNLLRVFYELGVRVIGLTHARRNAAATGGLFAASGSSPDGLTQFGRDLVQECEALGILLDLAHINAAGFNDILEITSKPSIVSHTNARYYYDIERNISDEQIKMIGERGGVIGVNSLLVSARQEECTLDRYVDHIEHIADLIGIDGVAIGFDFFDFIYRGWSEAERMEFHRKFPGVHFIPELQNHTGTGRLTGKLIERGFADEQIEKILFRNWMRILAKLL
jgi:membrane dipeptidase